MTLDATGFSAPNLIAIITDLETRVKDVFGQDAVLDSDSVWGRLIPIFSERILSIWEGMQMLYDAFIPQGAEGVQLDNIGQVLGLTRNEATKTSVELLLTGLPGTLIPSGSLVTDGTNEIEIVEDVTIPVGLTVTTTALVTVAGAIPVYDDSIESIVTPIVGWTAAENTADGDTGRDAEDDISYRSRIINIGAGTGASSLRSIKAELLDLDFVTSVNVVENDTGLTVDGRPPHSFEAIIYPDQGRDDEIAELLYTQKPAGIQAVGNESVVITDDQGNDHTISFSYVDPAYTKYNIGIISKTVDYPDDGDTQVIAALQAYLNTLGVGDDVQIFALGCAITSNVVGINDIAITMSLKTGIPIAGNIPIPDGSVALIETEATDVVVT